MPTTIEQLELQVQSSSTSAVSGIDALSASLSKLKTATKGGVGLTSVANQVRNLDTALKSMDSTSADKIDKLSSSLEKLKNLGSIKISSSIGNQLKNIGQAASSLTGVAFSGISKLSQALQPLNSLGKASGLQSAITQLQKLPQLAQTLNGINWGTFTSQIQQLTSSLAPLVNQLNSVSTAFSRLPSNISRVVTATNRVPAANNKAATSYVNLWAKLTMAINALKTGVRVLASWISRSNQYIEDINLFAASMGQYAEAAQEYAEQVGEIMGIDPGEWMRNQGVFNTIISGFGVASDQAYLMSKNLTQLGYDISSFFNISFEDAMQKLQSGISGELEPLRRLGYDLSVARLQQEALNLGIEKSVSDMTQAEKSQLRYYAIMTQVTTAQGDMARTLNAPANQLRVLQAQVTQCARALGNIFIPALNAVLPYAIALVKVLRILANAIASFFGFTLPEVDYSGISSGSSAVDDLTDSLGDATGASKKLKNSLLGIDELNILSDNNSSGSGSGLGVDVGTDLGIELPEYDFLGNAVSTKVDEIIEKMKEWLGITGEINSWSDLFKTRLGEIVILVAAIGAGITAWKVMGLLKSLGIITGGLKTMLGVSLAVGSSVAFIGESIDAWVNGLDINNFFSMIASGGGVIGGLALAFGSLAAGIGAAITGLVGFVVGIKDAVTNGLNLLNGVLIPLGATVSGAGIGGIIGTIIGSIGGPVGAGIGALIGLVIGLLVDLGIAIAQNWDSIAQWGKETGEKIKKWFDDRVEDVKAFPGEVIKAFKSFPKKLEQGIEVVSNWLDSLPGKISQWFDDRVEDIDEWFDDLWQPIKDYDWNNLGYDMGQWLGNAVKSAIHFTLVTIPTKISELTESIKKELKKFFTVSLPYFFTEWLPDVVQSVADFFLELPEKLGEVVSSIWSGLVEVGLNIEEGILEGLATCWASITEWVDGFVKGFCDALGIHSPSTVFRDEVGVFLGEGILEGLLEPFKKIGKWVKTNIIDPIGKAIRNNPIADVVVNIKNNASELWEKAKGWWTDITEDGLSLEAGVELVEEGWTTVKGWIGSIPTLSQFINLAKEKWSSVKEWIGDIPILEQGIKLVKSLWTTVEGWVEKFKGGSLSQAITLAKSGWNTVAQWVEKFKGGSLSQAITLAKSGWNTVAQWVRDRMGGAVDITINLISKWEGKIKEFFGLSSGGVVSADGGIKMYSLGGTINSRGTSWWDSVPKYAGGTSKAHGSMFVAGEAGAELVGHVNGTTEVLNRFQLAQVMHSSIVSGMSQFAGYWQSMSRDLVTCVNGIINAVVVSAAGVNDSLVFASASGYDPYSTLAQSVYEDSKKSYDGAYSDDSWSRDMREFYHDYVEPTLKEIATDTKRQADKREQTIVQVSNRTINDAVTIQKNANGYSFTE